MVNFSRKIPDPAKKKEILEGNKRDEWISRIRRRKQILFDDSSILATRRNDFFHSIGCDLLSSSKVFLASFDVWNFLKKLVSEIAFIRVRSKLHLIKLSYPISLLKNLNFSRRCCSLRSKVR